MDTQEKETLMLLGGGHPVHVKFADSINADKFQVTTRPTKIQSSHIKVINLMRGSLSVPFGYQYIICESCYFYPAIKRRLHLLGNSKIINLHGGPILYHVLSKRVKGLEAKMLLDLLQEVDGHLVYGSYGFSLLKKFSIKGPVRIIYPFVEPSLLSRLLKVRPNLETKSISIIATTDPFNKGLDLLFHALKIVSKKEHKIRLNLITRMSEKEVQKISGYDQTIVSIAKNVPEMSAALGNSSLYIQPSRADMFPVGCLEAMAAALPTIVSVENGAKEVVDKIDPTMVVDLDSNAIAQSILAYFAKSPKERIVLSEKFRAAAVFFNEKDMVSRFSDQFQQLKKEI